MLGFLIVDSWQAITTLGFGFFTQSDWDPVHNHYGALAFVYGTLVTSLTAMLIAVLTWECSLPRRDARGGCKTGSFHRLGAILARRLWFKFSWPHHSASSTAGGPIRRVSLAAASDSGHHDRAHFCRHRFDVCFAAALSGRRHWLWALPAGKPSGRDFLPYALVVPLFSALGRALGETMAVTMLTAQPPHWSPFARSYRQRDRQSAHTTNNGAALPSNWVWCFGRLVNLCRLLICRGGFGVKFLGISKRRLSRGRRQIRLRSGGSFASAQCARQHIDDHFPGPPLRPGIPLFLILGFVTYRGIAPSIWPFATCRCSEWPGACPVGSGVPVGLATLFAFLSLAAICTQRVPHQSPGGNRRLSANS